MMKSEMVVVVVIVVVVVVVQIDVEIPRFSFRKSRQCAAVQPAYRRDEGGAPRKP